MKRVLVAVFAGLLLFAPGARADPSPEAPPPAAPSVAMMQTMLADVGRWSLEYQTVLGHAIDPLVQIQAYVQILERFADGETRVGRATAEIESWRSASLAAVNRARVEAEALRRPPSFAQFGPEGVAMDTAYNAARDNVLPMIHEIERVVNNCADLGLAALREPGKAYDARLRVLLQSQVQLVRVDLIRLDVTVAALPREHPMQAISTVMRHYYATLIALPEQVLATPNGQEVDRAALAATLRATVGEMRSELTRARLLTEQTRARMRAQLGGPGVEIARAAVAVFDTVPQTLNALSGLAQNVDRAIVAIEDGEDLLQLWAEQESWDMPYLEEIERLDRLRASMLANNAGAL